VKKLMLETIQPSGHRSVREASDLHPESRIGQMFFPSGRAGEFGQIVEDRLTYSDGHVRRYYVEEVNE
jgi:hypothetical protein